MGQTHSEPRLPFESRGQVMKEMLDSEEKYVLILKKINSYYRIPLLKSKTLLSDKKRGEIIFANSEKLLEIHIQFHKDLVEEKEREPDEDEGPKQVKRKNSIVKKVITHVKHAAEGEESDSGEEVDENTIELETLAEKRFGRVFVNHCKEFQRQYHKYVSNYSAALKELIKCESKSRFRKFARKAAKKAGCPLTSFLVLPVLRIGEYAYLLNSLVALTSDAHPDFYDCKDAQELIGEVSEHINDVRRQAENINNIFQIQFSFVDRLNLIADHRILIKEGDIMWVHKKLLGGTEEKTVHFFLFNDIVIFAKHVASVKQVIRRFSFQKNHYKLLKSFPLSKTRLVALPGSSTTHNQLELTCGTDSYILQVHSKDEQRNYVSIFYKTSVEADLFKDVWPKSSLNIVKKKKSRKERREEKKAEKEASKRDLKAGGDEGTEDDEDEYEDTEYEESEFGGSDHEDDEFDDLWEDDTFIEEEEKKKMDPKQRVIAHIEKALSAVDVSLPAAAKRHTLVNDGKKVSPLGRSSNPVHLSRKKSGVSKSYVPERSKRNLLDDDDVDEDNRAKKKISKSLAPERSKRNLVDDDTDEEEDPPGGSKKGGRRASTSGEDLRKSKRKGSGDLASFPSDEKKARRKSSADLSPPSSEEEEEEEKEVRKSGKANGSGRPNARSGHGKVPRRRSDFHTVDDEDTPFTAKPDEGGCTGCIIF